MTQEKKVYEMLKDGEWHCQLEFWSRRSEVERTYGIAIEKRRCIHGQNKSFDYRFQEMPRTRVYRAMTKEEEVKHKTQLLNS